MTNLVLRVILAIFVAWILLGGAIAVGWLTFAAAGWIFIAGCAAFQAWAGVQIRKLSR